MKWNAVDKEKRDAKFTKWHVWWAWHPVKSETTNEWLWLENVYRKGGEYYSYAIIDRIFLMPKYEYKPHYLNVVDE